MANPTGKNQFSGGKAGGLSPARLARFQRDRNNASARIDKAQSDHAKRTGMALPRGLAARLVAGK